ncbi:hypothetical protein [Rhizobacter sp. Root1221]|uniref:hypothetical protein n=1 Tax=Rhizobacter sp. Root1221 TaxID=1736433 RepID=UPI000A57F851|nr:hypothetical protein [Rhizobacter sp. Root1221]
MTRFLRLLAATILPPLLLAACVTPPPADVAPPVSPRVVERDLGADAALRPAR